MADGAFSWRKIPILRILLPYAVGILAGIHLQIPLSWIWPFFLISFSSLVFLLFLSKGRKPPLMKWYGIFLSVSCLLLGLLNVLIQNPLNYPSHYTKSGCFPIHGYVRLLVEKVSIGNENQSRVIGKVRGLMTQDTACHCTGKIQVYLDTQDRPLTYGDLIVVRSSLKELFHSKNPWSFNYKQYLNLKGIYHQLFAGNKWVLIGSGQTNRILASINAVRNKLLHKIEMSFQGPTRAILSAMLLGKKEGIDDKTKSSFASTGTLHILAVSGLHTGIIYLIVARLLMLIRLRGVPATIISIVTIWLFAVATGAAPSVLRAATMFSFLAIGQFIGRSAGIYQSLVLSCLFLLVLDPFLLLAPGFQLSYLAVTGIVFFYPIINSWWPRRPRLINQPWALGSVSTGAQLGTLPLSLYYFGSLPTYFLVSNLAAIPFAVIILYSGILFLVLPGNWLVSDMLITFISMISHIFLSFISAIKNLPASSLLIQITLFEMVTLYLMIISISAFFINKKVRLLIYFLVLTIIIAGYKAFVQINQSFQNEIVVYHISRKSAIGVYSRDTGYLIVDSALSGDEKLMSYNIIPHWNNHKLQDVDLVLLDKSLDSIAVISLFIKNKAIIIPFTREPVVLTHDMNMDTYLILTGNKDLSNWIQAIKPTMIIIDTSVPPWMLKTYAEEIENIPVYNVNVKGAFYESWIS